MQPHNRILAIVCMPIVLVLFGHLVLWITS